MISNDRITEIFCVLDDFCKEMDQIIDENAVVEGTGKKNASGNLKYPIAR